MYGEPARSKMLGPRRACIADARLALSQHGLLATACLSEIFDLWLPTELREVLRAAPKSPEQLLPRLFCMPMRRIDRQADARAVADELALWDRLPEDPELAALRLYHLGDRADECVVPSSADHGLRARFEQVRSGLDLLMLRSKYAAPCSIAHCFRDAIALAAVLAPRRAFVLTRLESDDCGDPALCEYLEAWGVPTARAPDDPGPASRTLRLALESTGLAPLIWSGVKFAALHVVLEGVPGVGQPVARHDAEEIAARWQRAQVFWHPL
jgi:hypothetical protein